MRRFHAIYPFHGMLDLLHAINMLYKFPCPNFGREMRKALRRGLSMSRTLSHNTFRLKTYPRLGIHLAGEKVSWSGILRQYAARNSEVRYLQLAFGKGRSVLRNIIIRPIVSVLFISLGLMTGCAEEFVLFHSGSGDPLLLARRAYTSDACTERLKADAARLGVTLRYVHVRGNFAGRSLLWPIEHGYACEAAIGPEQLPTGAYPNGRELVLRGF
jgi:hypothetical protein